MKTIQTEALGFPVNVTDVPELTEGTELGIFAEAVGVFGTAQNLLDAAVANVRAHGKPATQSRDIVMAAVEKQTGIAPLSEVKKDAAGNPEKDADGNEVTTVVESPGKYVRRALAEAKTTVESLAAIVGKIDIKFDATSTPRSSGGSSPRIGKAFLEAATKKIAEGAEALAKSVKFLEKKNNLSIARDENGAVVPESLALAIKANQDRILAQANAEAGL